MGRRYRRPTRQSLWEIQQQLLSINYDWEALFRFQLDHMRPMYALSETVMAIWLKQIPQIAGAKEPVLIIGESGTGKELVAEKLHQCKFPKNEMKDFVRVNCAAITPDLLESELFGHAKGAFTGADTARIGLVARANTGTLFLDEFGELPHHVQAKLLRMFPKGEYRRVGEEDTRESGARIVAATNCPENLRADIRWRFPHTIELPPLRERKEDIIAILFGFLHDQPSGEQKEWLILPTTFVALFFSPFLGNVRELINAASRSLSTHEYWGVTFRQETKHVPFLYSVPAEKCAHLSDLKNVASIWSQMAQVLHSVPGGSALVGDPHANVGLLDVFFQAHREFPSWWQADFMDFALTFQQANELLRVSFDYLHPSRPDPEFRDLPALHTKLNFVFRQPAETWGLSAEHMACWNEGVSEHPQTKAFPASPDQAGARSFGRQKFTEVERAYYEELRRTCPSLKLAAATSGLKASTLSRKLTAMGLGYRPQPRNTSTEPDS